MKFQYTFTSDLEDTQEILYQKYNRIYNRNDLAEFHATLKSGLLNKNSLKDIEKVLTNYKDALIFVLQEVEENRNFLESLLRSLNDVPSKEVPTSEQQLVLSEGTEKIAESAQETEESIEQLSNIINSLTNMGNADEQTQSA